MHFKFRHVYILTFHFPIITEKSELQSSEPEFHFHSVSDRKGYMHWEYCPNPRLVIKKKNNSERKQMLTVVREK